MASNPKHSDEYYRALAHASELVDDDGGVEVDDDAIVSRNDDPASSHGAYVAAWVWVYDPTAGEFDQFDTRCPQCAGYHRLKVYQVTLSRTGVVHQIDTPLEADGFVVNLDDDKDQSTEDEKVKCEACDAEFTLDDLKLREEA